LFSEVHFCQSNPLTTLADISKTEKDAIDARLNALHSKHFENGSFNSYQAKTVIFLTNLFLLLLENSSISGVKKYECL